MKIWWVLCAGLLSFALPRLAVAECEETALAAMDTAKQARGVVSDLELMKAWFHDIGRMMHEDYARYGNVLEDLDDLGYRQGVSWMWWSDTFDGFRLCETSQGLPVDLDRSWWAAYTRIDDFSTGIGYELYYLAATDGLDFGGELEDFDYEWRQRIAGASVWWRDWARVSVGTIDVKSPSRTAEPLHDGSVHLNLGIPRFGIGADIVTQPGSRRVDTAMLGVRNRPLPWPGMTVSAIGGWRDDERRGLFGLGFGGLSDAVSLSVVFEGMPVRLRSSTLKIEAEFDHKAGDRLWTRVAAVPYLEVSAFNAGAFEDATGRSLVPGGATGVRAYWIFGLLQTGIDGFVGINRATELDRLVNVTDRVQWGARVYARIGL